jgi:hypothetical protein
VRVAPLKRRPVSPLRMQLRPSVSRLSVLASFWSGINILLLEGAARAAWPIGSAVPHEFRVGLSDQFPEGVAPFALAALIIVPGLVVPLWSLFETKMALDPDSLASQSIATGILKLVEWRVLALALAPGAVLLITEFLLPDLTLLQLVVALIPLVVAALVPIAVLRLWPAARSKAARLGSTRNGILTFMFLALAGVAVELLDSMALAYFTASFACVLLLPFLQAWALIHGLSPNQLLRQAPLMLRRAIGPLLALQARYALITFFIAVPILAAGVWLWKTLPPLLMWAKHHAVTVPPSLALVVGPFNFIGEYGGFIFIVPIATFFWFSTGRAAGWITTSARESPAG